MMCFLKYKIGFTPFCFSVPDLTKGSKSKRYSNPWTIPQGSRRLKLSYFQTIDIFLKGKGKRKGKSVPLQAWSVPEGSRKLRFPDFVTTAQDGGRFSALGTGCLYPSKYSRYSFLLEAESTPGP